MIDEIRLLYRKNTRRKLYFIFGAAAAFRIALLLTANYHGESSFYLFDSYRYMNLGTHLFENGIYAESIEEPVFKSIFVPPLAPVLFYLLKSIGGIPMIILFHIFCQLITCLCLLLMVQKFFGIKTEKILLPAGLLFASDIPSMVMGNLLMTETIFTVFLTLSVYCLLRFSDEKSNRFLALSSLFLGLAALTRPILIYYPVLLVAAFILIYRHDLKNLFRYLFRLLLPFYIVTGFWFFCNFQMFGSFFYSYVSDFNFAHFQATHIYAQKYDMQIKDARKKVHDEAHQLLKDKNPEEVSQLVFYSALGKTARSIILQNPVYFLKNAAKAHINLFFRPVRDYLKITMGSDELFYTRSNHNSLFIQSVTNWQIGIAVISYMLIPFGFIWLYKKNKFHFTVMLSFFAYFILVCSGPEIEARFRVPMVPEIILMSLAGLVYFTEKFRKNNTVPSSDNSTFV